LSGSGSAAWSGEEGALLLSAAGAAITAHHHLVSTSLD